MSAPELKYLPVANLIESTSNYRRRHDEAAHLELVASIKLHGILTPLVVRQVTQDGGWLHEVAAGHRRLRGARAAGLAEVPVVVREMTDREFAEIMLTENLQRVDPDPLDEAEGYAAMIAQLGYDVPTLAARFAKSETYIRQRMVLSNLSEQGRAALAAETIELGHAVLLARVAPERQDELLKNVLLASYKVEPEVRPSDARGDDGWDEEEETADGAAEPVLHKAKTRTTVNELRRLMGEVLLPLAPVKWSRDDASLVPSAGSCTACVKRTGANPLLFAELEHADDRCTDAVCYKAKKDAWLTARVTACRSQAPKLVAISTTATTQRLKQIGGLKVLRSPADYTSAKEGARGTVPAIVVETWASKELGDWDRLGDLCDVKLVKAEKVKAGPRSQAPQTAGRSYAEQTEIDRRFWVGVRAVVKEMAAMGKDVEVADATPKLVAMLLANFEPDSSVVAILRRELGDVALDAEEVLTMRVEDFDARSMRLAATVLALDLTTPNWWNSTPVIDDETGTFPIPESLVELASTVGVYAPAVWRDAIAADAEAHA